MIQFKSICLLTASLFFMINLTNYVLMASERPEQSIKNYGSGALTKIPDDCKPYLFAPKKDLKWFEDAKFGIFICWGPCSLKEAEIGWGRKGPRPGCPRPSSTGVPEEEYNNLYKKFNPVKFNADEWVKMVKDSGAKYIIFLTKHHDGFCMFDAKNTDYKITNTPFGRDVSKELADACHKYGIKLFWYYSQPDWYNTDYLSKHHEKYREYIYTQIRQLLTDYGKIDGIWFDCLNSRWQHWNTPQLVKMIRTLQPGILINNRWGWGMPVKHNGDFDTPEQKIGMFQIDRPWETCMTMGAGWSWRGPGNLIPANECIRVLIRCAGQGGNLALDCGPRPDGKIDPAAAKNYLAMGKWLKRFGYSIYGTRGGPYKPGIYGVCTRKGNHVYIHVMSSFSNAGNTEITLPGLPAKIVSAEAYNTSMKQPVTIKSKNTDNALSFDLSNISMDPIDTVITLTLDKSASEINVIDPMPPSRHIKLTGATASSEYSPEFKASNLLTNAKGAFEAGIHRQAYWIGKNNDKPAWFKVDLGGIKTINGIQLSEPRGRYNTTAFTIEYDDNGTWKPLYTDGKSIGPSFSLLVTPVKTGKLRLNILKHKKNPTLAKFTVYKAE